MKRLVRIINPILILLLGATVYSAAWSVFHLDLVFHTDIARDFLVLQDIVKTHHLTLLGPRAGGISGVFHGPLWFYINLPAFILGKGDPIFIGWFWVMLFVISLILFFVILKKLFDTQYALFGTLWLATINATYVNKFLNPYGAVILSPLFFYLLLQYSRKKSYLLLISSLFVLGLIIQFEMAFGMPILFLTFIYVVRNVLKNKRYIDLSSFFVLILPLFTFFLFELKHNFLQIHSVITYVTHNEVPTTFMDLIDRARARVEDFFIHSPSQLFMMDLRFMPILVALLAYITYGIYKNKTAKNRDSILLFTYLYVGYWFITLFYRDSVQSYYFWSFVPLFIIAIYSSGAFVSKKILFGVTLFFCIVNLIRIFPTGSSRDLGNEPGSWLFNKNMAETIYKEAPSDFGYYIFTPDQYGYSPRYGMDYEQRFYMSKKANAYEKRAVTYLIISPPPGDKPEINGTWWRTHQVGITRNPDKIISFRNGFKIYKYFLTPEEQKIPSDPNLISGLAFR